VLPTLGGEACAIAFVEKHTADKIIKNLIIISPSPSAQARRAVFFAPVSSREV
jgi:hypothetical protein